MSLQSDSRAAYGAGTSRAQALQLLRRIDQWLASLDDKSIDGVASILSRDVRLPIFEDESGCIGMRRLRDIRSTKELALFHGVTVGSVNDVLSGKYWRHV